MKSQRISFRIIRNFFMGLIACSTCICTKAIVSDSLTSAFVNWLLPSRKAGMFRFTFDCFSSSSIVKPRTAVTLSFGCQNLSSKIPDPRTMVFFKTALCSQLVILKTLWHGAIYCFSWRPNWDCNQRKIAKVCPCYQIPFNFWLWNIENPS